MLKIVDASTIAAIMFNEDEATAAAAAIGTATLAAPALILYELASIALKKVRREQQALEATLARLAAHADFDIALHEVDPVAAAALGLSTGLSAYDASYLWLARHLAAPLITLDRKLELAARA